MKVTVFMMLNGKDQIASFDFKENSLKALHKSVDAKLLIIRSKIEESLVVALKEIK